MRARFEIQIKASFTRNWSNYGAKDYTIFGFSDLEKNLFKWCQRVSYIHFLSKIFFYDKMNLKFFIFMWRDSFTKSISRVISWLQKRSFFFPNFHFHYLKALLNFVVLSKYFPQNQNSAIRSRWNWYTHLLLDFM